MFLFGLLEGGYTGVEAVETVDEIFIGLLKLELIFKVGAEC